jgi:hypothetical protein
MSWLFSQALVEEYSAGTSLDGEQSAQLNVMPTPHKFWHKDKTIDHSDLSRFGLTSRLLTEQHGAELLTSFLAGFHAKTSVLLAPAWASKANAAGYGASSFGSWAKFDRASCSLKTVQHSLLEDSTECSPILPRSGLMLAGQVYPRPSLEPAISVIAPGSLPTPLKSWGRRGPGLSNNLDNLRASLGVTQESLAIVKAVGWRWPASFVEWMMGWPSQWSALRPLETGKYQSWQQQHLTCSHEVKNAA